MNYRSLIPTTSILLLCLGACSAASDDPFESLTTAASFTNDNGNGDEMDDETSGDGDGESTGDGDSTTGDGDSTTGDGDSTTGDGDPTTGDGDGDPTTGDGDGDPTTGDGDGDAQTTCGWLNDPEFPGYYCGGMGTDPSGTFPIGCPNGLVEGSPCGELTGAGCCDAQGHNWYCTTEQVVHNEPCF